MNKEKRNIKVIYSSTNEKDLKDVILSLIRTHERKYNENIEKKVANV